MSKELKPKYPGVREAMDGNTAVIACERESSDGAGAYPITPSTQMGEYWAEAVANGHINISGRPLIFIEPEGEHAAAAVTAGLSMTGLRATNFSSGQGIAYMHESLYAAVGKRLTYILNMGCRAMTKASLNVHAGHDDYHAIDDTGFFQVFGKNVQEVCDLNIIGHRIAELSLTPGIVAQDGFLTTHLIESILLPERELIREFLGLPEDIIDCPTPAQKMIYGDQRRRIPELWTVDNPVMAGVVQNQDAYMQSVAAQRPFFFDHIEALTDQAMEDFHQLTGRRYQRVATYRCEDAEYVILGQGSVVANAEAIADYLRKTRDIKVGVVNITMFRPFPGDLLGNVLKGRKGVVILERVDQPLAEDLPLMREVRSMLGKCLENGRSTEGDLAYPAYDVYKSAADMPTLYSGSFGLGSRDLQPEALIGAVENMLPGGKHKKSFYLSIDFIHEIPYTPKQEVYQQQVLDGYPNIKDLAIHGSENPNLMPEGSITVRIHSVGGWGAITMGKNLAMTLFDLLGYHIKANPKYGSEKKGQPTTYYLSVAPEPIRMNCEYYYVDAALSPDPNVFGHSNPLAGLKKGGIFIIQSDLPSADDVWAQIPLRFQKFIVDNEIHVFYLDAFKIAREEASDLELQFRMQGNAFQGAFFKASHVMEKAGLDDTALFVAIEQQLEAKFGKKGARVVEDNVRVVRRGFQEAQEIVNKKVGQGSDAVTRKDSVLPKMLKHEPESLTATTDIHRFWEQTGYFYLTGKGGDTLTDPFIGLSLIPAATGVFRDMTSIRFDHPEWDATKCTGCGSCWTICPDSAIPGLVNSVGEILKTGIRRVEDSGKPGDLLKKHAGALEKNLYARLASIGDKADFQAEFGRAIEDVVASVAVSAQTALADELSTLRDEIKDFKFGVTRPFFGLKEQDAGGSGGLLSVTIDPYACKGCRECVEVCNDDALKMIPQTNDSVAQLRQNWEFWSALPSTAPEYINVDNLEEGIGTLETLLLNKNSYKSMVGGDGACLGCAEKTVIHIFTATVQALMQPRVKKHVAKLNDLINGLEHHIRIKMSSGLDLSDPALVQKAIASANGNNLTLGSLSEALSLQQGASAIDPTWLRRVTELLARLRSLRWQYTNGATGNGRSSLGMVNSTGCSSVWGSTYPFNPYPFPWTNHLFQDSPSMAMGLFEGHMSKMADGFRAIRLAELELEDKYDPAIHDNFLRYFDWHQFSDEEFYLCPPVVAVGGDGALYDIGFQNLSRMLMSGKPIKVVALDTQVYSNTGGQACTSGFIGQISDMAQYGKVQHGKTEIRKEIGLIGMAHRTAYIMQGTVANTSHMIEGFIQGLMCKRPAVFNIYCPCMPEHGIADDLGKHQAKLALESRAYPIFRFNPDKGTVWSECFDMEGNPAVEDEWPKYTLNYTDDNGAIASITVPMTFADFAVSEARFRKQFKKAPKETWNSDMIEVAEYLQLPVEAREGKFPFVWAIDGKNRLTRLLVSSEVVLSCEERKDFWAILRSIATAGAAPDIAGITQQARQDMANQIAANILSLAGSSAQPLSTAPAPVLSVPSTAAASAPTSSAIASSAPAAAAPATNNGKAPWLDSKNCNGCGDCVQLNGKIFAFNEKKQATILDPTAGPYKDLVRAAEKCNSRVIHPGLPLNPAEPDAAKWIKRGEKFN